MGQAQESDQDKPSLSRGELAAASRQAMQNWREVTREIAVMKADLVRRLAELDTMLRWEQKRRDNLTNGRTKWGWLIADLVQGEGRRVYRFDPREAPVSSEPGVPTAQYLTRIRSYLHMHKYTHMWSWSVRLESSGQVIIRRGRRYQPIFEHATKRATKKHLIR